MAKGYIVAELTITNPGPAFEEYRNSVLATMEPFGGRFLVRGGDPILLEGDHAASRVVILEFGSPEQAMAWYKSEQYQKIVPLRLNNALTRVLCAASV